MEFIGNVVTFRLSPEGVAALKDQFPRGTFEARVAHEDELGLWVPADPADRLNTEPLQVMLLKWQYFSTATVEYRPEPPEPVRQPGFVRPKS